VLSQVFFKKLAVIIADFAADLALERLDGDFVSVWIEERRCSTSPRLNLRLGKKFGSSILEILISFVDIVN